MEDEVELPSNSGSGGVAGVRPFPEHIVEQLKGLYEAGMVGTGRDYSKLHQLAYSRTGLSAGQVKKNSAVLLYYQTNPSSDIHPYVIKTEHSIQLMLVKKSRFQAV